MPFSLMMPFLQLLMKMHRRKERDELVARILFWCKKQRVFAVTGSRMELLEARGFLQAR